MRQITRASIKSPSAQGVSQAVGETVIEGVRVSAKEDVDGSGEGRNNNENQHFAYSNVWRWFGSLNVHFECSTPW